MYKSKGDKMLEEYDVVLANREVSQAVSRGAQGTILLILHKNPYVYEVELLDKNGDTLDILTVEEECLELFKE